MVRISKQEERRQKSPRRPSRPAKKTGPLKENLPMGYKEHKSGLVGDIAQTAFIPKIKSL